MTRPPLTSQITVDDFVAYYWLKEELMAFCRKEGLPASGSKQQLARRICDYLSKTKSMPEVTPAKRRPSMLMPAAFTCETVIGAGFRCSQELRAFFEQEIGPSFHFNGVMRDFIKNGQGKTLQQAIDAWNQHQQAPKVETAIDPQFEYNQHIRQFFKDNPGKTLQDAIAAWKEKRAARKTG